MKMQIIKQFEIGDCCFYTNPEYRKELIEDLNVSSLFGQIIEVGSDGVCTIKFIQNDGNTLMAKISAEELEWFDILYDMGPQTIGYKYGDDVSNNFVTRGVLFKAATRSTTPSVFKRGDVVFDLDRKAEDWFDDYYISNRHKDTFGMIDEIHLDANGIDFYLINYGEDFSFKRYPYEIGLIDKFPKKDDPWYSEYDFTRLDNTRMDLFLSGKLPEYSESYIKEYDKRKEEDSKVEPNDAPDIEERKAFKEMDGHSEADMPSVEEAFDDTEN